ncbi:MAG: AmmeMemoRadiSam system protein B [Archangium sp.]|nr:AmmeMemoRadiSam system protein B [Archangium sp.]
MLASSVMLSGCATTVPTLYPNDRVMWDGIFRRADTFHFPERPVAAVAPHHLVDAHELAGFWNELARFKPSVVVLIGPDHYYRGDGPLSTAGNVRWKTEYGLLEAKPLPELGVPISDALFNAEHSIHTHSTFITRTLPGVPFTAITVQWATPRAQLEALAQKLAATLPPDALVVASVDFSHYQPEPWATFHDASAFSTVSGFDLDSLFLREVDSPESLFLAMRFAQLRGAETSTRWLHTNSQRRRSPFVSDSTSHQYFTFTKGPVARKPSISVVLTGEGSGLTHHAGWTWQPNKDLGAPSAPILAKLRGQEDRFFMGPELTFFDFAPGEREVRVKANGLELIIRDAELINAPPEPNTCVVAVVRGDEAKALAVLSKAHVVLGRGFGAFREPEWDARVLALSLGDWRTPNSRGEVIGVTCTPEGVRLARVPIVIGAEGPALDLDALRVQLRPVEE